MFLMKIFNSIKCLEYQGIQATLVFSIGQSVHKLCFAIRSVLLDLLLRYGSFLIIE